MLAKGETLLKAERKLRKASANDRFTGYQVDPVGFLEDILLHVAPQSGARLIKRLALEATMQSVGSSLWATTVK